VLGWWQQSGRRGDVIVNRFLSSFFFPFFFLFPLVKEGSCCRCPGWDFSLDFFPFFFFSLFMVSVKGRRKVAE